MRGALVRDGQVLLVREVADGGWTLPGGWADIGEPPSASVEREFREESGVPVRAVKLIAVHDRDRHNFPPHEHHIFKLFFLCEATGERGRRARPGGRRGRLVRARRPAAAVDRAHGARADRARARSTQRGPTCPRRSTSAPAAAAPPPAACGRGRRASPAPAVARADLARGVGEVVAARAVRVREAQLAADDHRAGRELERPVVAQALPRSPGCGTARPRRRGPSPRRPRCAR